MIVGHIGGGQSDGYQVQRSLRLRASASAYASRVDGTGDLRTFTLDMCLKRGALGTTQTVFSTASDVNNFFQVRFETDDKLRIIGVIAAGSAVDLTTTAVFRDPIGHYHVSLGMDSTQASAGDRIALTVNGTVLTLTGTAVSLNAQLLGTWSTRNIGRFALGGNHFDGYISDAKLITGLKLPASNFGQSDSSGNWITKDYSGTYGTNGWRLKFDDPTSLTTLMADSSGNGNNWTATNISLTAGATYDSMLDVPLGGGGNERGNYATLNPLRTYTPIIPADGNLRVVGPTGPRSVFSTQAIQGKKYAEVTLTAVVSGNNAFGVANGSAPADTFYLTGQWVVRAQEGNFYASGVTNPVGPFGAISAGSVGRIAFDSATGKLWLGAGAAWFNSGDPAAGTGEVATLTTSEAYFFSGAVFNDTQDWNFGQRPFAQAVPTGFNAQHTGNLTSDTVTVSGAFTGNAIADGPSIWMNGSPETLTINGNAVTWGTHADKTAGGFKLRTSSASYNSSGSNTWTATVLTPSFKSAFRRQLAKVNP